MGAINDILKIRFLNDNLFQTKYDNTKIQLGYTIIGSIPKQLPKEEFLRVSEYATNSRTGLGLVLLIGFGLFICGIITSSLAFLPVLTI